ncbi:MAG: AAA family ATPase [Candidatus Njordarchaeales archaeon]
MEYDLELLREVAASYAKKAIEADEKGNPRLAIIYYYKAITTLKKLVKLESRERIKKIYEKRLRQYSARIQKLLGEAKSKRSYSSGKEESEFEKVAREAVIIEKPKVRWEDIADLENAKRALMEAIVWPLQRPDLFRGSRRPWKGILLFGPPGCGKTLLAKAVASNVDATFLNVDAALILSKWLGESEKIVKSIFNLARKNQPAIIFIDEVDAIASVRKSDDNDAIHRVKTIFLTEMDGLLSSPDERIVVIGATNVPEAIDPAFRRRFEKRIYVPLPDFGARKEIFRIHLKGVEIAGDVDLDKLAELTEGYTGHDIALVVREAIMYPIRELAEKGLLSKKDAKPRPVNMEDFLRALRKVRSSITKEEIRKYVEWARKYASE